jgi:outer membrane protein assembly factor BamB
MDSAWPMHGHDIKHTGLSQYSTAGNLGEEKWWYMEEAHFEGSPIIDKNGVIYYGSHDLHLYAINSNGTFNWRVWINGDVESSPAIDENWVLYVGTVLESGGNHLNAIYTNNGTKKWKYKTGGAIFSSPAIGKDGTIYFGSENDNIYALNPNGTLKWIYDTGNPVLSSPAIGGDGIIYCGSNKGYIYALYPNNGTLKWKYKTDNWVHGIPTIGDDGTVYCGSDDGYMYALYPNNGTMKWRCQIGSAWGSPAIDREGNLYIGVWEKKFHAINPNGIIKWSFNLTRRVWGQSPVVSDDGTIYFGTCDFEGHCGGPFHALNPDGSIKYILDHTRMFWASPAIGEDGTIYICTRKSRQVRPGAYRHTGYLRALAELDPDAPLETEIDGPKKIKGYKKYDYKFKTTSPLGNDVFFWIEWGDLGIDEWVGPVASGEMVTVSHEWTTISAPFKIRVKAKDTDNLWGPWSEFTVTMSRNKTMSNSFFLQFLERFPLLKQLLLYLY